MVRSRNLAGWCLIGAGALAGCRVGYDEIFVDDESTAGEGGARASGGSAGSSGDRGGTVSGAGEAGAATGGTTASGGAAGSAASGGASPAGGEGGAPASGGGGEDSAGGTDGSSGGEAGTFGGTTSGASGDAGEGGASDAGGTSGASGASGTSGAGGTSGMGGTSGTSGTSGAGGTLGSGGFAGASSLGDCQTKTFGGHDYVFCNVNVAWTVARDNCASIGMFLVRIDDATESQWVYDNVYDTPPRQGVWIGANDIAQEGEWRWPDGTLFWLGTSAGSAQNGLFNAWHPTQPSGNAPRDCGVLDENTLGWYDLDCTIPQPYACETP